MNLAIKFWADMPVNDRFLPDLWPAEVIEEPEGTPEGYTAMTREEYDQYIVDNIELFNTWALTYLGGA